MCLYVFGLCQADAYDTGMARYLHTPFISWDTVPDPARTKFQQSLFGEGCTAGAAGGIIMLVHEQHDQWKVVSAAGGMMMMMITIIIIVIISMPALVHDQAWSRTRAGIVAVLVALVERLDVHLHPPRPTQPS